MKKDEVRIGGVYLAKVTDKLVQVRIDSEGRHGGWEATNLATNKKVRIKSAQRLRGPAPDRQQAVAEAQATDAAGNADAVPLNQAMKSTKQEKAGKEGKEKKEGKKLSGLSIAYQILKDSGEPMNCPDLMKKMLEEGLWKTEGKTPAATLYSAILREIQTKGDESRFKKTDRGLFTVNAR